MKKELTAADRPDQTGIALLQALHVLNEWEQKQLEEIKTAHIFSREPNLTDPVHYYAWGLFKATLLKATKNRQDLKDWINQGEDFYEKCSHCEGNGRTEYAQNSETYLNHVKESLEDPEWYGKFEVGDKLYNHCTPCQGSGLLTPLDKALGK